MELLALLIAIVVRLLDNTMVCLQENCYDFKRTWKPLLRQTANKIFTWLMAVFEIKHVQHS